MTRPSANMMMRILFPCLFYLPQGVSACGTNDAFEDCVYKLIIRMVESPSIHS